jgi:hypothetical protein
MGWCGQKDAGGNRLEAEAPKQSAVVDDEGVWTVNP